MKVGIIGTGGRSLAYLDILRQMQQQTGALCDINRERLDTYRQVHLPDLDPGRAYLDYHDLLSDPTIDLVLICTPDTTHREIALSAAQAGKAMLLEKPVATTPSDVMAVYEGLKNYTRPVFLGFVLRYAPFYRQIKAMVQSGILGGIVTIRAQEMLDTRHASSFFRRWHRFSTNNGGLMNAKCCHDLDILNWLLEGEPVAVSAFGGNRVFVPWLMRPVAVVTAPCAAAAFMYSMKTIIRPILDHSMLCQTCVSIIVKKTLLIMSVCCCNMQMEL